MPTPAFNMFDYCNSPGYPGTLEIRLTTAAMPPAEPVTLAALPEPTFEGYRRATGPGLWAERTTREGYKFSLASRSLAWVSQSVTPVTITAVVLVGKLGGVESVQGIEPLDAPRTVVKGGAGLSAFVRHAGQKIG